jgi:hypothetical protein
MFYVEQINKNKVEVVSVALKTVAPLSQRAVRLFTQDGRVISAPKSCYFGENFASPNGHYWIAKWWAKKNDLLLDGQLVGWFDNEAQKVFIKDKKTVREVPVIL